ncbi:hypothetical protein SJDPG12_03070 [Porphyromonas gingivalis SJD12]|nr:hypothetical protein SJDPG4_06555 [Porphyromonas gingivalis SJD4]OWR83110.1 hypothetical protein SJDPG12_03070 [Porphyromonas gingivalis SJD12]
MIPPFTNILKDHGDDVLAKDYAAKRDRSESP